MHTAKSDGGQGPQRRQSSSSMSRRCPRPGIRRRRCDTGLAVPDRDKAALVRELFERYASGQCRRYLCGLPPQGPLDPRPARTAPLRRAVRPRQGAHLAGARPQAGAPQAPSRYCARTVPSERILAEFHSGRPNPRPPSAAASSPRHLRPVELQHLAGAVAGPLGRPHRRQSQLAQPPLDQVDRAVVAVLLAQELRRPRRLELGHSSSSRRSTCSKGSNLEPAGAPPVAGRLLAPRQPRHRPPIYLKLPRDLTLRGPVRRQRPHLRPLHRAPHLLLSSLDALTERPSFEKAADGISGAASGALFAYRSWRSIGRPTSGDSPPNDEETST
jgi:hypothetical protein